MIRSNSCCRLRDRFQASDRSALARDELDSNDVRSLSDLMSQIVDVFTKENDLDGLARGLDGGRGAGFLRGANHFIKEKIRIQREKILRKIIRSQELWEKKKSHHPFCRFIDKVSFTIGVITSLVTASLIGRSSFILVYWYTCLISFLVVLRLFLYRKEGYQYFLLDFCYFTTFLIFIYLYCFPGSNLLFLCIFAFSNGPLAWAVPLWRNSLVFHDLDKLTSCAIHIFPMLLTFQLRWFASSYNICSTGWPLCCDVRFSTMAILPLLPYIIWQLAYTLKTQLKFFRLTKPIAIANDDLIVTSFKWLQRRSGGPISNILRRFPTTASKEAAFVALQFIYTFATMTPTILYFQFVYLHASFIIIIISLAAWNGANFYVDVWTTRYRWADDSSARSNNQVLETADPHSFSDRNSKKIERTSSSLCTEN